jgi:hypothetical protein
LRVRKYAFLALTIAGLLASTGAVMADPATDTAQDDPNRMVCRNGEPITGTRLPGPRVCHTQKQWDDMRIQSQQMLEKMQNTTILPPSSKGG